MKKIFALFVLLLLMLSVTTVIAQEENEAEEQEEELSEEEENSEIEREAKILQTNLGAKIRLLLLEKAVMNAIARGEIVISYFEEKGKEVNSLKDIIDKLYSLNAEIQEMKNEDSLSVEKYVQLRKDAGNLIREFRKLVWDNTTPEERREIHSLLQDADYSFLDEIREEIRLLIREHNAQKTKEIRERIGAEGLDY